MEPILKKISSTAQTFLSGSPYAPISISRSSTTLEISESFPDPPPLLHLLLAAGARNDIAAQINDVYFSRVMEFKSHCENAVADACSRIAQTSLHQSSDSALALQEKIISAFTELYSKAIHSWTRKALLMLKDRGANAAADRRGNKPTRPFNHEYLPLLEHFFDENPFPTHADKAFLAKKSGMTYRQIHVWFQNRRSRTKKEGKRLRRIPMSDGATLPLDNLLARMERYTKKRHSPTRTANSTQLVQLRTISQPSDASKFEGHIFEKPAPQHAYPMRYPPSCPYDPFPKDYANLRSHQPHWPRQRPYSDTSRQASVAPISFAELIEKFSQMNVRGDDSACSSFNSLGLGAATFAITVQHCPSPHPSLICMPVHPRTSAKQLSAIPATRSQLEHAFVVLSSQFSPSSLRPVEGISARQDCSRRKVVSLPKRPAECPSTRRALSTSSSRAPATELSNSLADDSLSPSLKPTSSSSSCSSYSMRQSTPIFGSPAVRLGRLECTAELLRDLSTWYSPANLTTGFGICKLPVTDSVYLTAS